MIHPSALMAEETLASACKAISRALRHLKDLEAPDLRLGSRPPGGPARETAMDHLRDALRAVCEATAFHHDEWRRLAAEPPSPLHGGEPGPDVPPGGEEAA